jgi:hypothetical protein
LNEFIYEHSVIQSKPMSDNRYDSNPTRKRFADFDGDGYIDFIQELHNHYALFKIINDTAAVSSLVKKNYPSSNYEIIDLESDGDPDLVTRSGTYGNKLYIESIDLADVIYINDQGELKKLKSDELLIFQGKPDEGNPMHISSNMIPDHFLPYVNNGRLSFHGFLDPINGPNRELQVRYIRVQTNIPASNWYGE